MEGGGVDSEGRAFTSVGETWREEAGDSSKEEWYRQGVGYWEAVEASVDGVLGGYGHVSDADIKGSEAFLKQLLAERFPGGGRRQQEEQLVAFGAVSLPLDDYDSVVEAVDLLEPVSHFLDAARESLASESFPSENKAANFFCTPLQEFSPDVGRYNVIWIQWCIGHLADDDFVAFFKRAKVGLKPGGFFVRKENIARDGFVLDKEDRSVTRSDLYFKDLFNQCGLHLYRLKEQRGLPEELFAVKVYALTQTCLKDTELAQEPNPT